MMLGCERFQYTAPLLTWDVLIHGLPLELSSKPALAMVGRTGGSCSVVEAISVEVEMASVVVVASALVTSALVLASVVAADSVVEGTSDDLIVVSVVSTAVEGVSVPEVVSTVVVVKSTVTEELVDSV